MKIGDKVKMSDWNKSSNGDINAYNGMKCIVTDIYDDGAFALNCGNSILVVPMQNPFGPVKGVWIWLNNKHIFHKRIDNKVKKLKWYERIFRENS